MAVQCTLGVLLVDSGYPEGKYVGLWRHNLNSIERGGENQLHSLGQTNRRPEE